MKCPFKKKCALHIRKLEFLSEPSDEVSFLKKCAPYKKVRVFRRATLMKCFLLASDEVSF